MGRIKTALIKRITFDIYKAQKDSLSTNFDENKAIIGRLVQMPSKKLRNTVAGYLTRLTKAKTEI
jgi:small subunit ribosomal protein S17e